MGARNAGSKQVFIVQGETKPHDELSLDLPELAMTAHSDGTVAIDTDNCIIDKHILNPYEDRYLAMSDGDTITFKQLYKALMPHGEVEIKPYLIQITYTFRLVTVSGTVHRNFYVTKVETCPALP